ncbi:MAG TPA: sigma-70 family RNA polymerase sigma factor [Roseiflexaceae bacterium]|nr:sigma-70 family RNA polymerase sigma factor [Roseiflexaceae bacterium]
MIEEHALIERLRHGDEAAFEKLFLRHYDQVYRVLYHLVGSREEAEDLAQETFIALYHQPPALARDVALVAWLCRVALNRGYNALRGQRRAQQRLERVAEPPIQIDPQAELARSEERALVRAAIAKLPERQGRMLLLRYAGLSYAEIAAALGLAPASVGTLLARAERAFEAAYEQLRRPEPNETI